MKNKKLAIIWDNLDYGGVESYLIAFINNSKIKNYKVTIITNSTNKTIQNLKKKIINKNFNIIIYKPINIFFSKNYFLKIIFLIFKPLFFLASLFQLYFLLKKRKFDIFISQCGGFGDLRNDFSSMIIAKLLKFPVRTAVIHHCYTKPITWSYTINIINYLISKMCSSLIFVSKATYNNIKKNTLLFKNKKIFCEIINNGITLKKLNNKKIIFKEKNTIYALILSRIERSKGHLEIVKALNYLSVNERKKIKVYFVGKGKPEFISKIKNEIKIYKLKNNFVFTGFISKDSREIISNFDILLSPTRDFEGFGLSVAEALSAGVPVIATKVGGILDYLNKNNSILIEPKKPKMLARSLKLFMNNKQKYKKLASNGKKLIKKSFTADLMLKKYINHFTKLEKRNV